MKLVTLIARRFMLGGKGAGPSRFTGLIAVFGLAVGWFALIISLAVLNGFESRVTGKVIGFEGDLRISVRDPALDLAAHVNQMVDSGIIRAGMPYMERKGVIINDYNSNRMVTIKAVEFDKILEFYDLGLDTIEADNGVLVGHLLAQRMNILTGDYIKIMSPIDTPMGFGLPRILRLPVAGIFRAEVLDYDDKQIFIPLSAGRYIFTRKQTIDGIDLRYMPNAQSATVTNEIKANLPQGAIARSWAEIHQGLFSAMRMERIGAIIVLSLIIIVASFNLASTLALITYQKVREIGILRTMGMTKIGIRNVLVIQGLMIGGIGAVVGISVALIIVFIQQWTGFIPLPAEIYVIKAVPMVLYLKDLILVPLIAFSLILVAANVAGKRAIQIQPKDAVQLEK